MTRIPAVYTHPSTVWLAGMGDVVAIYRKKMFGTIVSIAIFSALCLAVTWMYFHRLPYLIGICIGLTMGGLPFLFECRRAIVFTTSDFVARRNTGTLEKIPLASIAQIEETSITYMLGTWPVSVPAVRLMLNTGRVRSIPVDYPDREEIVAKLRKAIVSSGV